MNGSRELDMGGWRRYFHQGVGWVSDQSARQEQAGRVVKKQRRSESPRNQCYNDTMVVMDTSTCAEPVSIYPAGGCRGMFQGAHVAIRTFGHGRYYGCWDGQL